MISEVKVNCRVQSLKAMYDVVEHLNNDNAYELWLSIGCDPDPPLDELLRISNDDHLYHDYLDHFMYVLRNYYLDGYME